MRKVLRLTMLWAAVAFAPIPALAGSGSSSAAPSAVVRGPASVKPGDLVVLDASSSTGSGYAWIVIPDHGNFLAVEGGTKVVFASGAPGAYTFVLAVASGGQAAVARHLVTVGALPPIPPSPGPGPTPPGPGPLPDRYGLATWAVQQIPLVPEAARGCRAALAKSFTTVASAIAAGALSSAGAIIAETAAANRQALAGDLPQWKPFLDALGDRLDQLAQQKTLATPSDYLQAWKEIAAGLAAP